MNKRWPNGAKAIWLCADKRVCKERYGEYSETGHVDTITLPSNAVLLSDLQEDGQLWVYSGEEEWS